jgi:aspartyl-tRNA(Asn)/glutamyl-tRNA(Gln) amidotransferase subunit A
MFSISKRPTIQEIWTLYKEGKATPVQVSLFFLNRSKEIDKKVKSILRYTEELADSEAMQMDDVLLNYKEKGEDWFNLLIQDFPLFGIPYTLKDITMAQGEVFSAASLILKGFNAPYSSTLYKKLNASGAICIGISNMDEFAHGASTENSAYAITTNPFDENRVPGGSSGGAAACVGSGQAVFAIGTDTGGSIRLPASFCDCVGLKPTYGLVSRYGVMAMSSSMEQPGPITNNVEDALRVTLILMGKDPKDQTSINSENLATELQQELDNLELIRKTGDVYVTKKPLKIGLPKEFYLDGINPIIVKKLEDVRKKLEDAGHEIIEVSIPSVEHAISVYYLLQTVEVSSNLERYDGIRYANFDKVENKDGLYFNHREKYFGEEAKRRIMLGTYTSSAGYYDAYYNQAMKVRELARQDFTKVFKEVDVLLTPVSTDFPFLVGEKSQDPLSMYLIDVFTCAVNPILIPGLAVPFGLLQIQEGSEQKLPAGCQILGPELSETKLFQLAKEIEVLK